MPTKASYLLMTAPAAGHVNPVGPIARYLTSQGHKVLWITGRKYQKQVEQAGAVFHPLHPQMDPGEKEMYDFYPPLKTLKGTAQIKYYIKHVFLDNARREMEVITEVLSFFPADVLIGDTVTDGVYFSAEKLHMPSLCLSVLPLGIPSIDTAPFGVGLPPGKGSLGRLRNRALNWLINQVMFRDVNQYANTVREQLRLPAFSLPYFRASFTLPTCVCQLAPASFEYPRSDLPGNIHFVGPVLPGWEEPFTPPDWWPELKYGRKVVLINQGTIATDIHDLILPAIEALKKEDLLLIAVPVKPGQITHLPAQVKTAEYIPFTSLLPHVDLMITNGGYGGTQFALSQGIPLVVAGGKEDKMEVAARVAWSGAGINLRQHSPSPERIRKAVKEVLANPTYRQHARRLQADIATYDAPKTVARLLGQLATARTTAASKAI